MRLCGRVNNEKTFTRPISGNKTTFFWPKIQIFFVMNIKRYNFSNFVFRPTQSLSEYLAVSFSK